MARKCSSCGNNGHNSRTCSGHRSLENYGGGGVRLFGVQLHVGSSPMKKCFSMECLSSSAPAYYAAALAGASSSSPSVSSSSSHVSVDETAEKMTNGYLSDGLMGRAQERKKGVPWTEDEHRRFLAGLEKLGKGNWRGISRHFVTTRTPTQVASHAQNYFLRQGRLAQKKRRSSTWYVRVHATQQHLSATATLSASSNLPCLKNLDNATSVKGRLKPRDERSSMSEMEFPALSLGISRPKPDAVLHPSPSLSLTPSCSAAMSSASASLAPRHPSVTMARPQVVSLPAPDLELKISTARQTDQTGSSLRTPFFGTIRVT